MDEPTQQKQAFTTTLYPIASYGQPRIVWVMEERENGWLIEATHLDNWDLPTKPIFLSKEVWSRDESKWLKPQTDEDILKTELDDIFGIGKTP